MADALEGKLAEVPKPTRVIHVFKMPERIPGDIRSVGIKELTGNEEVMASKRASGDPFRIAQELAKQALVEVNGEPVNLADGSSDKTWANMHPQARELIVTAHRKIHSASEEDVEDFLKSATVRAE